MAAMATNGSGNGVSSVHIRDPSCVYGYASDTCSDQKIESGTAICEKPHSSAVRARAV